MALPMIDYVTGSRLREVDDAPLGPPGPVWRTLAVMLLLALVVYLPAALRAQFLGFDDNLFFGPDNPEFRDVGLAAALDPRRTIANAYLPVAHASLWLDYWLGGGRPLLPHLVALVLHGLVGAVFVRLLLRLRLAPLPAYVAGALFVVHPALAESVAWVSGRKDLLSGLFVLAALLQTAKYAAVPGRLRLLGIAVLGVLAMYSKATAVVQPLLALAVCWLVPGSRRRFLAPLVLLLVTVPIAWHHQQLAAAEGTLAAGSPLSRLGQVPGAYLHYLGTAFWPQHLNVLYPELQTLERFRIISLPALLVVGAGAVAALLGWRWPSLRRVAFGLLVFLVALLPFNTALPASSIAAADRYLYLALPGAALAVAATADRLFGRRGAWLAALLVLPLAYRSGTRAHDFGDTAALWRASLAADPDNAVAHYNLAFELLQRPPAEVAVVREHLEAAVTAARYPIHALRPRLLLAQLAMQLAEYDVAAQHARAAIAAAEQQLQREVGASRRAAAEQLLLQARLAAFEPLRQAQDLAGAAANHAAVQQAFPDQPEVVAFEVLRSLEAVAAELTAAAAAGGSAELAADDPRGLAADQRLAAALVRHPDHPQLLVAQASWERVRGRVLPALKYYKRAQTVDPQCMDAWLGAARMLRERESYADAVATATAGLRHRPDPALLQEQALALVGMNRMDDAITLLEAYLRARPNDADAAKVLSNVLIGRAYARLSEPGAKHDEVLKIVERALAYYPKEPRAHLVLGRVAREQGRFVDAVQHLEQAHRLMPGFEDAQQLLADSLAQLGYQHLLAKNDEAAADAWRRCVQVAPAGMDLAVVKNQMLRIWRLHEERGVEKKRSGDLAGAVVEFRRCLEIVPEQHWAAWLLATTLRELPDPDHAEIEQLCRLAVAWQLQHGLDRSQQVWLLAATLRQRQQAAAAAALASDYLAAPDVDAKPQFLQALKELAGG